MKSLEIEKELKLTLPLDYKNFIDKSLYEKYDGFRPQSLAAHWSEEMMFPLCFDPEITIDVYRNRFVWDKKDPDFESMAPLAVFYSSNSTEQLSDMDDFISVKFESKDRSSVHLWDHEGYFTQISESLKDFLGSLIPVKDKRWKMKD